MMNLKEAFAVVARYQKATEAMQHLRVGDGVFALVAVFESGRRVTKAIGFETAEHAQVFAAFAAEQPQRVSPEQIEAWRAHMAAQGVTVDASPWKHFEIVRLEPVVTDDDLASLLKGGGA